MEFDSDVRQTIPQFDVYARTDWLSWNGWQQHYINSVCLSVCLGFSGVFGINEVINFGLGGMEISMNPLLWPVYGGQRYRSLSTSWSRVSINLACSRSNWMVWRFWNVSVVRKLYRVWSKSMTGILYRALGTSMMLTTAQIASNVHPKYVCMTV